MELNLLVVCYLPQGFFQDSPNQRQFWDIVSNWNLIFPHLIDYFLINTLLHLWVLCQQVYCPGQSKRSLKKKPQSSSSRPSRLKIISSQEKQSAFNYVFYMFKVMKQTGNDSHLDSVGCCQTLPSLLE